MSANPIPAPSDDSALQSAALPIAEFEAVCVKHSIACCEPDSFGRFMRMLHADKHFAMDFWSLVARLIDRVPSVGSGPLLTAIVHGVTGHSLEEVSASGRAAQLQLKELIGLLAGEDVQTPLPPRPVQSAHPSNLRAHLPRNAVPRRSAVPPPQPAHRPNSDSSADSIDHLVPRTDTPFAAAMDRNLREREPGPDPQEPEPLIAIPLASAEENAPASSVSRNLLGGILLTLAAGVLLYHSNWKRLSASLRIQYAAALASRNHPTAQSAASINADHFNPGAAPTTQQPAPTNPNPPQALVPYNAPSAAPPPRNANTRQPHAEAQIVVPEALMRQNLISSRVPIFPPGAGPVVIEAIVTARGTVEPLRVVTGDPALARPALAAAATWRYRPYLQDGIPINVSTTISIDASGNN